MNYGTYTDSHWLLTNLYLYQWPSGISVQSCTFHRHVSHWSTAVKQHNDRPARWTVGIFEDATSCIAGIRCCTSAHSEVTCAESAAICSCHGLRKGWWTIALGVQPSSMCSTNQISALQPGSITEKHHMCHDEEVGYIYYIPMLGDGHQSINHLIGIYMDL